MNLNLNTYRILERLGGRGNTSVEDFNSGRVTLVDVGLDMECDLNTALKVAEATLAGLGRIDVDDRIRVEIDKMPAVATIGSQMAGWCIKLGGEIALGSGPVRILAKKPENVFERIGYSEASDIGALILETSVFPDREACEGILQQSKVGDLIIAVFKGDSLTGLVNVLSRVVEVGIYRLFNLGFDINRISYARGTVPMIEPSDDVMFEANDAIIYKGFVELKVDGWDSKLTGKATSRCSRAYGKSFKEIFQEAHGNFYKIPEDIFAPAELNVIDLKDKKG
jgi:methenyltetrahydromethanopterin cyclohydrolase